MAMRQPFEHVNNVGSKQVATVVLFMELKIIVQTENIKHSGLTQWLD